MIKVCTFGDLETELVYSSVGTLIEKNLMYCLYKLHMENRTYLVKHYYGLFGWLGLFDPQTWQSGNFDLMMADISYKPSVGQVVYCSTYYGSDVHKRMMDIGACKYIFGRTPVIYCEVDNVGIITYVEDHKEKGLRYLIPEVKVNCWDDGRVLELLQ